MFCCLDKKLLQKIGGGLLLFVFALGIMGLVGKKAGGASVNVAKHEWGLSFQVKNAPPVPNLTAEELAPYNAFYISPKPNKRIYLTFDAGYENGYMPAILDALKKHNAPAAFFVVEPYIKENPDIVLRMVNDGHIVGNHTHHHPNMSAKDKDSFIKELRDVEAAFLQLTGKQLPSFYRPPEGKFSTENLSWTKALGYKTFFWSIAYRDWLVDNQPSHEDAINKLMERTHDGAVVLLHSTSKTNAEILDALLTKWEEQGYTFGSLYDFEEFCS